jgi:hypothetical protein
LATPSESSLSRQPSGTLLPVEHFFEEGKSPLHPVVNKKGDSSRSSRIVALVLVPLLLVVLAVGLGLQLHYWKRKKRQESCQDDSSGTLTPSGSSQMLMTSNSYDDLEEGAPKVERIDQLPGIENPGMTETKTPQVKAIGNNFKSIKGIYGCEGVTFRGAPGFMFPSTPRTVDRPLPLFEASSLQDAFSVGSSINPVPRNRIMTSSRPWNTRSKRGATNIPNDNTTICSRHVSLQGEILYTTTGGGAPLGVVAEESGYPSSEESNDKQGVVLGDVFPLTEGSAAIMSSPHEILEYPASSSAYQGIRKPSKAYRMDDRGKKLPVEAGPLSLSVHHRSHGTSQLDNLVDERKLPLSHSNRMVLDDDAGFQEFLVQLSRGYAINQVKHKNAIHLCNENERTVLSRSCVSTTSFSDDKETNKLSSLLVPPLSFGASLSEFSHSSSSLDIREPFTPSDSISAIGIAL